MATLEAPEDDYDFVERPSEDFFCPVTLDLLQEPHLTPCCGNHLSQEAVSRLQGQPCPVCKETNLTTMPDKFFKRKVNELKVRCPNKSLGCEWVGELGSLNRHLSRNSVEGECQFVTVACPYSCGDDLQRCQLEGHRMNDCPNRPLTCQYCDYEAKHTEVTTEHWPVCEKYPLQCPNECGGDMIERQDLEEHLDKACPLQVVECEFGYAGCGVECQRQQMEDHVNNSVKLHLSLVSKIVEEKDAEIDEQDDKIGEQGTEIENLQNTVRKQQKQIVALMSALNQLAHDVQKPFMPVLTFVPPPDLVMVDFEKHKRTGDQWHSPPFYSHIGGYKMCLSVDASGQGSGKGTHLSVYVHFMRGEYDDQLKWPFHGDITIQLLNQETDVGHCEKTLSFDDRSSDMYSGRVVGRERGSGWGYQQFTRNELSTNCYKNDCVIFRISEIAVNSV